MTSFSFTSFFWGFIFAGQILFAQQDNGNLFEMTWSMGPPVHNGGTTEMGAFAPEGLDIDQDGRREFLVYDHVKFEFPRRQRVQLWENQGHNDFRLAWEVIYTDWAAQFEAGAGLTVADLDRDNRQEVIIAAENHIYIYEWDGTTFESGQGLPQEPTLTLDALQDAAGQSNVRTLRVQNLDSDPDLEIFMGYSLNTSLYCVIASLPGGDLSNPDWKIEFADDFLSREAPPGGHFRVGGISIGDFDEDGKIEIFTSHWQDVAATRLYENDGADNYVVKHTNLPETLIMNPSFDGAFASPIFHDFNGDGDSEFLISDIHGHIFVITKQASNNFEDFGPSAWTYIMNWPQVPGGAFVRSGYMGDLDQDGKPDIYYNDFRAMSILDLEFQGGSVTDPSNWIPYEIYEMPGVRFGNVRPAGDLDGDGRGELVLNMGGLIEGTNLQIIESLDVATSVGETAPELPESYVLHQNYPNPFNPETRIRFELPQATFVVLKIFDILGAQIRILLERECSPGSHLVRWDTKDQRGNLVPSGVYFYGSSPNSGLNHNM